jgi:hypothetical protein
MTEKTWQIRLLYSAASCGLILSLLGCNENILSPQTRPAQAYNPPPGHEPTPEEITRMLEPNVLGVSCFYDPFKPWIWNTEHTRIRGIKVSALYLRGPNHTGVFGAGIIRPQLFMSYRDEKGAVQSKLIKEWVYDVDQAMQFRAKTRRRAGWGYALFLDWGDLDLSGKHVRLTISFERTDGVVISGSKKEFRVPKSDNDV